MWFLGVGAGVGLGVGDLVPHTRFDVLVGATISNASPLHSVIGAHVLSTVGVRGDVSYSDASHSTLSLQTVSRSLVGGAMTCWVGSQFFGPISRRVSTTSEPLAPSMTTLLAAPFAALRPRSTLLLGIDARSGYCGCEPLLHADGAANQAPPLGPV